MTDRPIIFSGPMIRALLSGQKTQTRRVVKASNTLFDGSGWPRLDGCTLDWGRAWVGAGPSPAGNPGPYLKLLVRWPENDATTHRIYPKWQPGDRLWVRETWNCFAFSQDGEDAWPTDTIPTADDYREVKEEGRRVDIQLVHKESERAREFFSDQKWRSPLHMPRWASRLTLRITEVRVERLQAISSADAIAEGIPRQADHFSVDCDTPDPRDGYRNLWESIHGTGSWDANPWVWALTFEVEP